MISIPITILTASTRPYKGRDGSEKKWNSVNTLIDGNVVELSTTDELVNKILKKKEEMGGAFEVTGNVEISQSTYQNKKNTQIKLVSVQ